VTVSDEVTIVSGLRGAESRVVVPIHSVDDEWVYVHTPNEPEPRRFSRVTGFEHREGGGWSTWRLAGKDFRRFKIER
jgi:hypothetical protein